MAIAYNSSADLGNGLAVSSLTASYTVGSGSDRLFVAGVLGDLNSDFITGATYAGAAMTLLYKQFVTNTGTNHRWQYFFYLLNPASGANNLVVSASSPCDVITALGYDGSGYAQSGQPDVQAAEPFGAVSSVTTQFTTTVDNDWAVLFTVNFTSPPADPTAGAGLIFRVADGSFHASAMFDSNGPITPPQLYTMVVNQPGTPLLFGTIAGAFSPASAPVTSYGWIPAFDDSKMLKRRPLGFSDMEFKPPLVIPIPKQHEFFGSPRLLKPKEGFIDNQTNIQTIVQPLHHFPAFEQPSRVARRDDWNSGPTIVPSVPVASVTFSPFEQPVKSKQQPGFVDLQTKIQTIVPLGWGWPPFDSPATLKRVTGFIETVVTRPIAIPNPVTFAPFDLARLLNRPPSFDDRPAPLPAVSTPMQAVPFDQSRVLLRIPPGFDDRSSHLPAVMVPIQAFPFDPPRLLLKIPPSLDDRPMPLPAVSTPMQAAQFPPSVKLNPPADWPFVYLSPTITAPTPPVFAMAPPFDQHVRPFNLRALVVQTGFDYLPQFIVQITPPPEEFTVSGPGVVDLFDPVSGVSYLWSPTQRRTV